MGADPGIQRRKGVEALVLALSHSKVHAVVGEDALRTVLGGQSRELVRDGVLYTQPAWDLLMDQPGISQTDASAAFCLVKSWERGLGLEVRLPEALATLSATEVSASCAALQVPKGRRERLFVDGGRDTRPPPSTTPLIPEPLLEGETFETAEEASRRRRLEIAAALIALVGFAIAGVAAYSYFTPTAWDEIRVPLPGALATARTERFGKDLGITLNDSKWAELSEGDRREELETALRGLNDFESLFVRDASGAVKGSAHRLKSSDRIVVRLP